MNDLVNLEKKTQMYRDLQKRIENQQSQIGWLECVNIHEVQLNGFIVDVPKKLELKSLIIKQWEEELKVLKEQREIL